MALLRAPVVVAAATTLALAFAASVSGGCNSCQGKPAGERAVDAGVASGNDAPVAPTGATPEDDLDGAAGELAAPAGNRFRDAQPRAEADGDGPVDAACVGAKGVEVSLATAVVDERCAIGRVGAKRLRALLEHDSGPPVSLRQEAKVLDDGRVALRLVNTGPVALKLPLIFSATLPAFLVMAEDEGQTLYELAAPRFDVAASKTRAHFARIVLEPGGVAVATIAIDPTIASVVARRGGDRADAGASRLPKGHYVLRVGELLTDVEAGAPARVPFDVK